MKKIIIFILISAAVSMATTINILNWEPEYKYTSIETYPYQAAKEYCENKKDCEISCEASRGRCTINKTIKNCPALKTGNMDEYIATPFHMHMMVKRCFALEHKLHYEGHVVSFVYKNNRYYVNKIQKYDNKYGYIFKITKTITKDSVKFKEN